LSDVIVVLNFWRGESPYAEGHCQSDMFFCALRVVCGLAATYREAPGTTPNKNDDSWAHFGGLFLWAKSPHGFMARQLILCPGICFFVRKSKDTVSNTFCK
jgi:hypothetical protein